MAQQSKAISSRTKPSSCPLHREVCNLAAEDGGASAVHVGTGRKTRRPRESRGGVFLFFPLGESTASVRGAFPLSSGDAFCFGWGRSLRRALIVTGIRHFLLAEAVDSPSGKRKTPRRRTDRHSSSGHLPLQGTGTRGFPQSVNLIYSSSDE